MTIPIGKPYILVVQILTPGSFVPLDVTGYEGNLNIFRQDTLVSIITDKKNAGVLSPEDMAKGMMQWDLNDTETGQAVVEPADIGDPADNFYIKSRYAGFISVTKTGEPAINAKIESISFIPVGS